MKQLDSFIDSVVCLECGHGMCFRPGLTQCVGCGGSWLDARYRYDTVASLWKDGLGPRTNTLWRYSELLPVSDLRNIVTLGEGRTPLLRATTLERELQRSLTFIKDERQAPTRSFKDRQAAVAVTSMVIAGTSECAIASTGNAAVSYSAYCARARIKLWVFLPSFVSPARAREIALYGAEVTCVAGTYDDAKKVAARFANDRNIRFDGGARTIAGKESMKTIAFEIAEDLSLACGTRVGSGRRGNHAWSAPDWYIQAVSGGIGPLGVHKGFTELRQMGLIDHVPKIGVIQVSGCAPMARAFAGNRDKAVPLVPDTAITILSTGDPGFAYELLVAANKTYGGSMIDVGEEAAYAALDHLAKSEGCAVEPAAAVAFAGLEELCRRGVIRADETVVVNCSGHSFPP